MYDKRKGSYPGNVFDGFKRRDFLKSTSLLGASAALSGSIFPSDTFADMPTDLNPILVDAVAKGAVPFVVAMVGDANGVTWAGSAGERAPGVAADADTVFRIFSMTKAIGSTAAMVLIDRGKLDFDTPVEDVLPKFSNVTQLDGFDSNGQPKLRAPSVKPTIRHLATHTSGLVYEFWNADMAKYMAATKHPTVISGLEAALYYPLVFKPGERWGYGLGIDWLGQVVEAVDGRRIDQFCKEEILGPLRMADTQFEVEGSMKGRLAAVSARGEDGGFAPFEIAPPPQPEVYGMGHALYSTAPDYMRFLRMFLQKGELDGERVLSEAGVDSMLTNHIGDVRVGKMTSLAPPITADVDLFPGIDKTHSFAFLRNEQDVPGMRSAGSQCWAGVCNTHYWFDPSKNVAAVIMTQSLPFVEPQFMEVYEAFEKAVYANIG